MCKKLFLHFPQWLISQLMCLTKSHIPLMHRKRMHMTKMNRIYTFDIHFCLRPFQVERKFIAIDWCFQPDEVFKCNVQIPEEIRPHFCSLAILSIGLCCRWRNMLDHGNPSLNWFLSEMRWHETCRFYFENGKKTSTRLKLQGELWVDSNVRGQLPSDPKTNAVPLSQQR